MIPNILSLIRIILVPLFLFFFFSNSNNSIFLSLLIFTVASITDFFDGFIARKFNQISTLGKFLDPLADKILTLSVFSSFLFLDIISYWMFFLIISRDIIVTLIRIFFKKYNLAFVTSNVAKIKTTIQIFVIIYVLSSMCQNVIEEIFIINHLFVFFDQLGYVFLTLFNLQNQITTSWIFLSIASIVTFYSGLHYIYIHRDGIKFLFNKNTGNVA
tara:strand:- start:31836 stop:32480 length:645 start_codon:yes stop_codon:yes gene_type:complete